MYSSDYYSGMADEWQDKLVTTYTMLMEDKQWENKQGEIVNLADIDDRYFNNILKYAKEIGYIDKKDCKKLMKWRREI